MPPTVLRRRRSASSIFSCDTFLIRGGSVCHGSADFFHAATIFTGGLCPEGSVDALRQTGEKLWERGRRRILPGSGLLHAFTRGFASVKFLKGLFHGGATGRRKGMNNVRRFVALVHMWCRTMVTDGLNVDGVGVLPSLTVFGHALGITARGGGLNITRGSHYGGVLVRVCGLGRGFFGRVSTSVGGGYHGMGVMGDCFFRFRHFGRDLVVTIDGRVGCAVHVPFGGVLCARARTTVDGVLAGGG